MVLTIYLLNIKMQQAQQTKDYITNRWSPLIKYKCLSQSGFWLKYICCSFIEFNHCM